VLNQTIVSLSGYPRATAGWVTGTVVFVVATLAGSQLFLRVEVALLLASAATVTVMVVLLLPLLRTRASLTSTEALVAAAPPAEV
jgi:hypothetical protein